MCGIAGVIGRTALSPTQLEKLARVNDAMFHRGPDGEGHFLEPGSRRVALAMRRLSIVDIAGGAQPLYNEDRTMALVANGEIYNADELRTELESRGHQFRSRSDCEVILHLYEEHGEHCVHRLRGMFAFALYDGRIGRVLVARDRLGEKPLYLHETPEAVYFASEAKALIRGGVIPFNMNADSLYRYMHWGFVPGTQSAIEGVRKLRPGHYIVIDLADNRRTEVCYWDPRRIEPREGDGVKLVREEIEEVSRLIVRSDVPIGVCLSAGVDSSAIAALTSRVSKQAITGVTVGFTGHPRQDERDGARRFAKHLGISLIEIELSPEDAARAVPGVCGATDEPLNDSAGTSIFSMMERCREEGLKVMLAGLGGDELFWGYSWVRQAVALTSRKYDRLDGVASYRDYLSIKKPAVSYNQMRSWLADAGGLRSARDRWISDARNPERLVFWDLLPRFTAAASELSSLLEPEWLGGVDQNTPFEAFSRASRPARVDLELMCTLLETYLCENGLGQSDRLSSANSVEMRTPLVDYGLVELAIGLQRARPTHQHKPKETLLAAVDDLLPTWVKNRPKTGFSNPWRAWERSLVRQHGLLLIDGVLVQRGILRADRAAHVRARLDAGLTGVHDDLAHALLRLELWARSFEQLAS